MTNFDISAETLGVGDELALAGTYRRTVHASLERVWENVFDWEHLPSLHETSFSSIELIARTTHGWRVRVGVQPRKHLQLLELRADRPASRYCVRTLEGAGQGTQIWTLLNSEAAHQTAIEVRYYIPEHRPERLAAVGAAYRRTYERLWDEDETMMQHREKMLESRSAAALTGNRLSLGNLSELRLRLPLLTEFAGRPLRVIELAGELIAHSTVCPHMLGPLDHASIDADGCVRCPWHSYRFDVRTGRSAEGRAMCLPVAPQVVVEPSGQVFLADRSS
jgi:nitrite reductase/ring-hydroxylating ferredoxin subunit